MTPAGPFSPGEPTGLIDLLSARVHAEPFLAVASGLFALAIVHTFLAPALTRASHRNRGLRARALHIAGEIELVFALWAVVLLAAMVAFRGPSSVLGYMSQLSFTEPLFVLVIMAIAGSRPVLQVAEQGLGRVAALGGGGVRAWWVAVLGVGPLLGSFITEPAAMTICALILRSRFYGRGPSQPLAYATLGLLFVNISLGGAMTPFGAPPIVMVASRWGWSLAPMLATFGWRCITAITVSTLATLLLHGREFARLEAAETTKAAPQEGGTAFPGVATAALFALLLATLVLAHSPAGLVLVLGGYAAVVSLSLGRAWISSLRQPAWVGLFLAGLVVHGGLQAWWLGPVLGGLGPGALFSGSAVLSAFNDNAAITYLAAQIAPPLAPVLQVAVVAGAITGGGLTVIANAPNPAGQALLAPAFGEAGIGALGLLRGAALPTAIAAAVFALL